MESGWLSKSEEDATRSEEAEKILRKDDHHDRSEGHHSFGISVIVSCLPLPPRACIWCSNESARGRKKNIELCYQKKCFPAQQDDLAVRKSKISVTLRLSLDWATSTNEYIWFCGKRKIYRGTDSIQNQIQPCLTFKISFNPLNIFKVGIWTIA